MDLKTEKNLVERAKYDKEAFAALYDFYYSKIYKYSLRRTGNTQVSLDITSTVFIKALKNIKTFEWRDFPFSSWLYKIATNEINNLYKNKQTRLVSLETLFEQYEFEPTAEVNIEEELIKAEKELQNHQIFLKIQKELLKLDISYQEVISLRFFENKKIKEIAQILDKKEGTIKSLLSRGLSMLRKNLTTIYAPQKVKIKNYTPLMQPFKVIGVIPIEAKS